MKLMIDTNVILDCMLDREPFRTDAEILLEKCARGEHKGCLLATTITDILYIAGKSMTDLHQIYLLIEDFMEDMFLISVRNSDIMEALDRKELDFEDCLMSVCSENAGCDYIVTRNIKDFKNSKVPAITPKEFCRMAVR